MYVRWKKRAQTRRKRPTGDTLLYAALVKSVRAADGVVRQAFIAHLGSIRESAVAYHYHQLDFWATVDAALDKQQLEPAAKGTIERSIERLVARPTAAGKAATAAQLAQNEGKL